MSAVARRLLIGNSRTKFEKGKKILLTNQPAKFTFPKSC